MRGGADRKWSGGASRIFDGAATGVFCRFWGHNILSCAGEEGEKEGRGRRGGQVHRCEWRPTSLQARPWGQYFFWVEGGAEQRDLPRGKGAEEPMEGKHGGDDYRGLEREARDRREEVHWTIIIGKRCNGGNIRNVPNRITMHDSIAQPPMLTVDGGREEDEDGSVGEKKGWRRTRSRITSTTDARGRKKEMFPKGRGHQ